MFMSRVKSIGVTARMIWFKIIIIINLNREQIGGCQRLRVGGGQNR